MTETDNLTDSDEEPKILLVKKPLEKRYFLIKTFYKAILIFLGYAISYLQYPFLLLFVVAGTLIWLEQIDNIHASKIKIKSAACSFTKQDLTRRIHEIPSWVKFPDRHRAEWLNQVIAQLWPTVSNYVIKLFRTEIQAKIQKKVDSFQFESIDFGNKLPKIDRINVTTVKEDSIIIDFDICYDGNCDINFSYLGTGIGGVQDFQVEARIRIVLKPFLTKLPLIGGIQIYFLNTPDISFTLDGLSSIPGLSSFIRSKIEEEITKVMVIPNKITKRFSKSVVPFELKALEAAGVLRVHVFEAKDLMGKDITGKSDPFVTLYVGAQEHQSNIINQDLNPKWDFWCEFIIIDPEAQHLGFKLFGKNNVNEDDFLGSGEVEISSVLKGHTDQLIRLDNATHGSLHLRFAWLSLSSDIKEFDTISKETKLLQVDNISTAVLTIYVEKATKIHETKQFVKPHPFLILTLGEQKQKSRVIKHTTDPCWEQGFVFLVANPWQDSLHMAILDKPTKSLLAQFSYKLSELIERPNLEISKNEFLLDNEESTIVLSLKLEILKSENFEIDNAKAKTLCGSSNLAKSPITHTTSFSSSGEFKLGQIEISLEYNKPRQKLLVTIHRVCNLPVTDISDVPDFYVKIKMYSLGHTTGPTYRTKVVADNCNPVYDETFEYLLSKQDVYEHTILVTVKAKKMLYNETIGQVEINLKYVNLSESYQTWLDLHPKSS